MYKIELLENDNILKSKELNDYESIFNIKMYCVHKYKRIAFL